MYSFMKMKKRNKLKLFQEWGNKGEWWRGWIQLWYTVRTFVNAPQYNSNIIKKEASETWK
jgi:hypothetical protein